VSSAIERGDAYVALAYARRRQVEADHNLATARSV
jgi:hypothetical protein